MNQAMLIGRVGKDPEMRYTQSGEPIANFSLATSERWKDKSGAKQERTEWHRVTVFNPTSKVIRDYVKKGDQIAIVGKIHYSEYTDRDGNKKHGVEIQVGGFGGQVILLGGNKREGDRTERVVDATEKYLQGQQGEFQATDDDVPF